ncbi:6-phosphogluconolactonase [Cryobacterium sp. 10S3]|uniref:6-phosphogluconolactonase n=1 Tax=Cryobacterium sp. 10S3 TaxID=3048582 RepID=UPI002AC9A046|nr:6-phosphogluconolactonase [Cryobacterium sp. 10S3]MEB0287499.1 6-phosphogluconolactonase [Cryobacterium sp. 10S3]WPX13277.1 6-phosphogluconolactonase [Cryobacterium sp. 10S3]
MPTYEYHATSADVARAAALDAVTVLDRAIREYGSATWVVAGGTSPTLAYRTLVNELADSLDWSKVTAVIGDERVVPIDDPDSNWGLISGELFRAGPTSLIKQVSPAFGRDEATQAFEYEEALRALPSNANGLPRLDLLWLGVGEDGHTLSLFPGHPDNVATDALVIAVHNSPKPPPTRISLTLRALDGAIVARVFATGAGKKDALAEARQWGTLPIAVATARIEAAGGEVTWLYDSAAAPE